MVNSNRLIITLNHLYSITVTKTWTIRNYFSVNLHYQNKNLSSIYLANLVFYPFVCIFLEWCRSCLLGRSTMFTALNTAVGRPVAPQVTDLCYLSVYLSPGYVSPLCINTYQWLNSLPSLRPSHCIVSHVF